MRRVVCGAWALALVSCGLARAADPLAEAVSRLEADGYRVERRLGAKSRRGALAALFLRRDDPPAAAVRVYRVAKGRATLVHFAPGGAAALKPHAVHSRGTLPDLFGDGSRWLVYTSELEGVGQWSLHVARSSGPVFESAGPPAPQGTLEDADGDGRPEVVRRDLPLGGLFSVECDEFRTTARSAYRTSVFAWNGERFSDASRRHASYFEGDIKRREDELAAIDPKASQRYGDFLAAALTLYFDYERLGRPREGWTRFAALARALQGGLPPLPRVRRCMESLDAEMRRRLAIPADW